MSQAVAELPQLRVIAQQASHCPGFRFIAPDDVPAHWGRVEKGIASILAKCEREPWTSRDIRRALRAGRAQLFVREEGFVVLERCQEPISGEPYLNVWLMWFAPGTLPMLRKEVADWLDETREQAKCEWWQFTSPREGWGKFLEDICEPIASTWGRR